jgi:HSP20 family protein
MLLTSFDPFAVSRDRSLVAVRMDAVRRDNEIELRFDLPGIDRESIDVTVDRGVLTVSAKRSAEYADNEKPFIRERFMGTFTRKLRLADTVDAENIAASYDGGVLTVHVPLTERAQPRKVEVGTSEPTAVAA